MPEDIDFVPASSLSIEALADLFTRSFAEYFYPADESAEDLAWKVRVEGIDLWRSVVMRVGGEPAGLALLGLRPGVAWCGGFGVTVPFRGRGLALPLAEAMVVNARASGARRLTLEVLTRNERAIRTYRRAGLVVTRDLLIVEWRRPEGFDQPLPPSNVVEASWAAPMRHFAELHPSPPAWQRDLPALLMRGAPRCLVLDEAGDHGAPLAYALSYGDEAARIVDLGARDAAAAGPVLQTLQSRHARLSSVNEPAGSPQAEALLAAGFVEVDRQHEMELAL
ncbi:MAG: hypothetical protein RLZZ387_276 [Chloroflexota bacterium]|jgi:RimJ/RimL family protein N-acetyltransferase